MPRRGDHIHKRKDNRWEGRFPYGTKENGATAYRSVYAKTYKECKEKLEAIKNERPVFPTKKSPHSFASLLYQWIEVNRVRLKGATVNKYSYMVDTHIAPELGHIHISKITANLINSFLNSKMKNGSMNNHSALSPSYVKTMAIIIEATIKYAVSEGHCAPLLSPVHKPVTPQKSPSMISPDTEKRFREMLSSPFSKEALGALISLHTGMRIGEICALRWEDIDFYSDIIRVQHTISRVRKDNSKHTMLIIDKPKTEASLRQIPISSALKPLLLHAYEIRESAFVVSRKDSFVSPRTFDYRYRQMLKTCQAEITNFHSIRHTFATRCIEVGIDHKSLCEILGHANVATTLNVYVHPSMDLKKRQLEKLYSSAF